MNNKFAKQYKVICLCSPKLASLPVGQANEGKYHTCFTQLYSASREGCLAPAESPVLKMPHTWSQELTMISVFEFQDDVFLQKPFGPCPRIWKVSCWRERGRKEREHEASYLDSMSCLSYTSMIGPEASVAGVRPVGIRLAGRALVSMSQTFKKLFLAVPV